MSRACIFLAGGRRFAIRADRVREIVYLEHVTRVPLTPRHLVGVSNLRGTILPVVDLPSLLGLDGDRLGPAGTKATLSCTGDDFAIGLSVDEIVGIEDVPEKALRPVGGEAPEALGRSAVGALERAGETTVLLDIDSLIRDSKIVHPVRLAEPPGASAPTASPARSEA